MNLILVIYLDRSHNKVFALRSSKPRKGATYKSLLATNLSIECHRDQADGNETSQSEWSEDDDEGGASEPLLDQESTAGYTTDDAALEHASVMNEAGLTDAEGEAEDGLSFGDLSRKVINLRPLFLNVRKSFALLYHSHSYWEKY